MNRLKPVDLLTVIYLLFGPAVLVLAPDRPSQALLLGAAHLAAIAAIALARRFALDRWRPGAVALGFYPLIAFGLLYSEVGVLVKALHGGVLHDATVQGWEEALFGSQPAVQLHEWWPWRALGEYLHLGYFAYYFLTPVMALVLWLRRPRIEFETAMGTVAASFYICFTIFVLYPVAGPYHAFPRSDPAVLGYVLPGIVRSLLDRGSSIGAAFPSSHVAVSVTVWIMAMRYHVRLARAFGLIVPALVLGVVYGGYHYAVDALAGAVVGLLVGTAGWAMVRGSSRRGAAYPGL